MTAIKKTKFVREPFTGTTLPLRRNDGDSSPESSPPNPTSQGKPHRQLSPQERALLEASPLGIDFGAKQLHVKDGAERAGIGRGRTYASSSRAQIGDAAGDDFTAGPTRHLTTRSRPQATTATNVTEIPGTNVRPDAQSDDTDQEHDAVSPSSHYEQHNSSTYETKRRPRQREPQTSKPKRHHRQPSHSPAQDRPISPTLDPTVPVRSSPVSPLHSPPLNTRHNPPTPSSISTRAPEPPWPNTKSAPGPKAPTKQTEPRQPHKQPRSCFHEKLQYLVSIWRAGPDSDVQQLHKAVQARNQARQHAPVPVQGAAVSPPPPPSQPYLDAMPDPAVLAEQIRRGSQETELTPRSQDVPLMISNSARLGAAPSVRYTRYVEREKALPDVPDRSTLVSRERKAGVERRLAASRDGRLAGEMVSRSVSPEGRRAGVCRSAPLTSLKPDRGRKGPSRTTDERNPRFFLDASAGRDTATARDRDTGKTATKRRQKLKASISRPQPLMSTDGRTANIALESGGVGGPAAAISLPVRNGRVMQQRRRGGREELKGPQRRRRLEDVVEKKNKKEEEEEAVPQLGDVRERTNELWRQQESAGSCTPRRCSSDASFACRGIGGEGTDGHCKSGPAREDPVLQGLAPRTTGEQETMVSRQRRYGSADADGTEDDGQCVAPRGGGDGGDGNRWEDREWTQCRDTSFYQPYEDILHEYDG